MPMGAVEDAPAGNRLGHDAHASMGPDGAGGRRRRHGRRHQTGGKWRFNGATVRAVEDSRSAWRRSGRRPCFNGAMALGPWKTGTVLMLGVCEVASMGPRRWGRGRRRRGVARGPRPGPSFNGATVPGPWKTPRPRRTRSRSPGSWGHGAGPWKTVSSARERPEKIDTSR